MCLLSRQMPIGVVTAVRATNAIASKAREAPKDAIGSGANSRTIETIPSRIESGAIRTRRIQFDPFMPVASRGRSMIVSAMVGSEKSTEDNWENPEEEDVGDEEDNE